MCPLTKCHFLLSYWTLFILVFILAKTIGHVCHTQALGFEFHTHLSEGARAMHFLNHRGFGVVLEPLERGQGQLYGPFHLCSALARLVTDKEISRVLRHFLITLGIIHVMEEVYTTMLSCSDWFY